MQECHSTICGIRYTSWTRVYKKTGYSCQCSLLPTCDTSGIFKLYTGQLPAAVGERCFEWSSRKTSKTSSACYSSAVNSTFALAKGMTRKCENSSYKLKLLSIQSFFKVRNLDLDASPPGAANNKTKQVGNCCPCISGEELQLTLAFYLKKLAITLEFSSF